MNKKVALIVLMVTCSALIFGALIHATSFQNALPSPTQTPTPTPTSEPQTEPELQPEPEPSPVGKTYIVVPDDYATLDDAVHHAAEGATIYFRKGNYEGPINQTVVIDKTLSIVGESAKNTVINLYPAYNVSWILTTPFFSYSDAISITADDFTLLNLTVIIYPGGDISITGNRTQIIGNNVTRSYSSGITVQGSYCRITDNSGSGPIRLNGSFSEVARNAPYGIYIEGSFNVIRDNVCQGIAFGNSKNNIISGNNVTTNSRSYCGISFSNSHNNLFYRNRVAGFGYGVELWLSSNNIIMANAIIDCDVGSFALGEAFNNRIYLNLVKNNNWWDRYFYDFYSDPWVRDGNPNMTVSVNFWDNGSVGNYWGDYNGSDANGDGIGDLPYTIKLVVRYFGGGEEEVVCVRDNFPLMAPVEIDSVSIELPEWANTSKIELQDFNLSQPSSTTSAAISSGTTAITVSLCLIVYFKKRKR